VDAARQLDDRGYALLPGLLDPDDCAEFIALFRDDSRFRSTIEMASHAYGEGRYRYFAYPLPSRLEALRTHLYEELLPIARRWHERLAIEIGFPEDHAAFLARCHEAGQTRPTPLVLRYEQDGYNRLHQDVYGAVAFPLQVACLLSSAADFEGGDFLVSENRARMQVRAEAIPLSRGDGIVIANDVRPVASKRGWARAHMRHGLSRLRSGER
jgi:hypothetical protein